MSERLWFVMALAMGDEKIGFRNSKTISWLPLSQQNIISYEKENNDVT